MVQLGADDELLPEYCSATSAFIDAHPGYDIYASNAYRLLPDGTSRSSTTRPALRARVLADRSTTCSTSR